MPTPETTVIAWDIQLTHLPPDAKYRRHAAVHVIAPDCVRACELALSAFPGESPRIDAVHHNGRTRLLVIDPTVGTLTGSFDAPA